MMYRKGGYSHMYIPELKSDAIELAYGLDGRFSMLIILPRKSVRLTGVIDNVRSIGLNKLFQYLKLSEEDPEMELFIPRFTLSSEYKLKEILRTMGLVDIFDPQAVNLSRISQHPVYISEFVQKSVIKVDEAGTTAASANALTVSFQSIPSSFQANKPFAFLIVERTTKSILFCGQVRNPNL